MMCERPPRSLRSCERIGDKGSDPKVCCWICDIPPEGLTPCPQFVHSFFARVSPHGGGESPKEAGGRSNAVLNWRSATAPFSLGPDAVTARPQEKPRSVFLHIVSSSA